MESVSPGKPVWNIAPPTTKRPIIIITTELENPDNASSGVRMWKSSNKTKAHKATTSERILPLTKNTADKAKIINVTTIQSIF
jgi:hypothetical protein